jgi:protein-tyrosine phosphatase
VSTEPFAIHSVTLPGGGEIGLCRMPGREGRLAEDMARIAAWSPTVVVTLTETQELAAHGVDALPQMLARSGIGHRSFPIVDFGVPGDDDATAADLAQALHPLLDQGRRVLVHCMGGCGRSGMIALRLMVERGEAADAALARLRAVRPCAVETERQMAWASAGHHHPAVRPK